MTADPLFDLIPNGEKIAVPAKALWEAQARMWSVASIKGRLNKMIKAGEIERRYVSSKLNGGTRGVYFRKPGK